MFNDSYFEEAARFIVENQIASTSMLQRKFCIGYNRAGRLMNLLQAAEIIGPVDENCHRGVLIPNLEALNATIPTIKSIKHDIIDDFFMCEP